MEYHCVERIPLSMTKCKVMNHMERVMKKQRYASFHKKEPYQVLGAWHSFMEDWRYGRRHAIFAGLLCFNRYGTYPDPVPVQL